MKSNNMHYRFYVEYFDNLPKGGNPPLPSELISSIEFDDKHIKSLEEFAIDSFSLYTTYPGLLIGLGYPHAGKGDDFVHNGFSFDYATGIPYLPGASLKGILRSYFDDGTPEILNEKHKMVAQLCNKSYENEEDLKIWINAKVKILFEGKNMYLGAYPVDSKDILGIDVITPHHGLKAPNPNKIMKIKPNREIKFYFRLDGDESEVEETKELFKQLLLIGGIGAKTNVGFGQLVEEKVYESVKSIDITRNDELNTSNSGKTNNNKPNKNIAPQCRYNGCNKKVSMNKNTGKWYPYCFEHKDSWKN